MQKVSGLKCPVVNATCYIVEHISGKLGGNSLGGRPLNLVSRYLHKLSYSFKRVATRSLSHITIGNI